jgi:type VI secretion system protein ImpH
MAPKERQPDPPLRSRLFSEFFQFSFYKAVSLLEGFRPGSKRLGETLDPKEEAVRFSVKPGLSFPPSDISDLQQADPEQQARMDVRFLGLIGPSGVLPHWFNELLLERIRAKDFTLVDFFDIFHHRLLTLFYLAWKRTKLTASYVPGARDRLSWYLLSLIGLGTEGLRGRIGLPEESLIYCSGLLSRQVPSAVAVEAAARYMANADAAVDQFIERMIPLEPDDYSLLGGTNASLGVTTVCGSFARDCQSTFRVRLGPVGYGQFCRFLPSGDLLKPIFSLIRYMVGVEYEFEIRVLLLAAEVPGLRLGDAAPGSPRLGWSTWLKTPATVLEKDQHVTFQERDALHAAN